MNPDFETQLDVDVDIVGSKRMASMYPASKQPIKRVKPSTPSPPKPITGNPVAPINGTNPIEPRYPRKPPPKDFENPSRPPPKDRPDIPKFGPVEGEKPVKPNPVTPVDPNPVRPVQPIPVEPSKPEPVARVKPGDDLKQPPEVTTVFKTVIEQLQKGVENALTYKLAKDGSIKILGTIRDGLKKYLQMNSEQIQAELVARGIPSTISGNVSGYMTQIKSYLQEKLTGVVGDRSALFERLAEVGNRSVEESEPLLGLVHETIEKDVVSAGAKSVAVAAADTFNVLISFPYLSEAFYNLSEKTQLQGKTAAEYFHEQSQKTKEKDPHLASGTPAVMADWIHDIGKAVQSFDDSGGISGHLIGAADTIEKRSPFLSIVGEPLRAIGNTINDASSVATTIVKTGLALNPVYQLGHSLFHWW